MFLNILKRKFVTVLVCVIAFILILTGIDSLFLSKFEKQNFITDAIGIVVSPVQGAFSWMAKSIGKIPEFFASSAKLREENAYLKQQIVDKNREIEILESYKTENERLRGILDLKQWNREYEIVGAEVIARQTDGWKNSIKLDKGTINGIKKGDVVVSDTGLVGYISDIGTTWATVTTIVSPQSSVSCIIPRTGEIVMLDGGELKDGKVSCKLSYLPSESVVSEGEAVETSGDGGIYPKGILVGRVSSLYEEEDGVSKSAEITPVADFKHLSEVLVMKIDREQD